MIFGLKKLTKKERLSLLVISCVFFLCYIIRIVSGNFKLVDSDEYLYTADIIKNGQYFYRDLNFEDAFLKTRRPFFYPLFLAAFGSFNLIAILFIQTLLGIFNAYLLLQLYKKLQGKLVGYFTLFFIFSFSIFVYTQLIMSEWLAMLLLTLLSLLLTSDFNKKRFFWIQIITALLAFTKPVFFPIIYLNLFYFSVYFFKKKNFSFSLFIPAILLFLYLGFNNYRTSYTHFSSIENTNLIDYNLYYYKSSTESKPIADQWVRSVYDESQKYQDFKTRSEFIKSKASEEIRTHFISYSWYHFHTAVRGIFDPGRFDLMTFFKKEDGRQGFLEILNSEKSIKNIMKNEYFYIYLLLIPALIILLAKLFFSAFFVWKGKSNVNFLNFYLLILVLYYILITGPVNSSRLMMPFQGLFIVFATLGIQKMKERIKTPTQFYI
ncbi:MAG: hypothetical protein PSV16_03680 [Flavobacterium sp.]|nr:hypothetical protein [Flavobacterium sp.]